MRHLFIINPAAGSRDRSKLYEEIIKEAMEARNLPYEIQVSQAPGQCRELARQAAEAGDEIRIYACGGDGTLNEVVSGVQGYPNVAVTMFTGGSGNDFIRIFDDREAFQDLNRLLDSEEAVFDLIACNEQYSFNVCSVGLDARIGTDVARYKRLPLLHGFWAYAVSALVNVIRGVWEHYVVEVNGETVDEDMTLVCACNGRYYGGGFNPAPYADPTDGLMDVLLVKKVSRLRVATAIGRYKNGQYEQFPQMIRHLRTGHLVIRCDRETPINLDGELLYGKTVDIRMIPKAIRFFYPKGLSYAPKMTET